MSFMWAFVTIIVGAVCFALGEERGRKLAAKPPAAPDTPDHDMRH